MENATFQERSKFREFFGQFAEPAFYADLAKTAIVEVLKAAALAFAGALTVHVQRRLAGPSSINIAQPTVDQNSNLSQRAFGDSGYPNQYNSNSNRGAYYPTTQPSATFPGFGNR